MTPENPFSERKQKKINLNSPFFQPKQKVINLEEYRKEKELQEAKGEMIGMLNEEEVNNSSFLKECLDKGYIVLGSLLSEEAREEIESDLRDVPLQKNVPEEIEKRLKDIFRVA